MKNHYRYTKLLNSSHIGNKKSRQHHLDVAALPIKIFAISRNV